MQSESNYFTLRYTPLRRAEREKRLAYLNDTVSSLRAYKIKARPYKRNTIEKLIVKYETFLFEKGEK